MRGADRFGVTENAAQDSKALTTKQNPAQQRTQADDNVVTTPSFSASF